jgi:hypothetical protein
MELSESFMKGNLDKEERNKQPELEYLIRNQ